jgi:hypothetical protein
VDHSLVLPPIGKLGPNWIPFPRASRGTNFALRSSRYSLEFLWQSSAVLRRTVPTQLDAGPSLHSISIGPASAANAGGFLQVVESKARKHATLPARLASSRFRFNTKTCRYRSARPNLDSFRVAERYAQKPDGVIVPRAIPKQTGISVFHSQSRMRLALSDRGPSDSRWYFRSFGK